MARSRARLALTAGLAAAVLAGCSGPDQGSSAPAASSAATPSAPPVVSAAPSPVAPTAPSAPVTVTPGPEQGSEGGVVLGGEELGVTRLGAPFRQAVAAVSEVLGEPDAEAAEAVSCIDAETEVRWGELVLASEDDRLAGWASRSMTLQTPSGVTVGTPLSEVVRVHGSSLERPADPDNPATFSIDGVDVSGELSSEQDDATVTRLFTSLCAGP